MDEGAQPGGAPAGAAAPNEAELRRYIRRIADRWPLESAWLGGAQLDDLRGAPPQRERGPEFVIVLISARFDGIPWLERVYQASSLWDSSEMGFRAEVHCYTPPEFARKLESLPRVRKAAAGADLLAL